jgi:hypothetical protein
MDVKKMAIGNDVKTAVMRGKASFARILGDPVLNYNKDGKEWKMDFEITKDSIKELKDLGIGDRVKSKDNYLDGAPFLSFKQAEFKRDGKPNEPIKVVDIIQNPWPQDTMIGNGSDIEVKFVVVDYGPGKKSGVYIRSVRVLNLVRYDRQDFETVAEDDPFYANVKEAQMFAEALKDKPAEAKQEKYVDTYSDLDDSVDEVL